MSSSIHSEIYRHLLEARLHQLLGGRSHDVFEALRGKINLLRQHHAIEQELESHARVALTLLEDVARGQYLEVSLRCFVHLCVTVDYFLDHQDDQPDHLPDGFHDDLREFVRFANRFAADLNRYKAWKRRQPAPPPARGSTVYHLREEELL
jgi:hypothetical protein